MVIREADFDDSNVTAGESPLGQALIENYSDSWQDLTLTWRLSGVTVGTRQVSTAPQTTQTFLKNISYDHLSSLGLDGDEHELTCVLESGPGYSGADWNRQVATWAVPISIEADSTDSGGSGSSGGDLQRVNIEIEDFAIEDGVKPMFPADQRTLTIRVDNNADIGVVGTIEVVIEHSTVFQFDEYLPVGESTIGIEVVGDTLMDAIGARNGEFTMEARLHNGSDNGVEWGPSDAIGHPNPIQLAEFVTDNVYVESCSSPSSGEHGENVTVEVSVRNDNYRDGHAEVRVLFNGTPAGSAGLDAYARMARTVEVTAPLPTTGDSADVDAETRNVYQT